MRFWPTTLTARLALLIAAAALPVFAMLVYGDVRDRQEHRRDLAQQAQRLADLIAQQQTTATEAARTLLMTVSRAPALHEPECTVFLAGVRQSFPELTGLGAMRPDGFTYCTSYGRAGGIYLLDRPYVRDAIAHKRFTTSGYNFGRAAAAPSLNFAYPILDPDGSVHGAVIAAFSLASMAERLAVAALPPEAAVLLVDDRGTILARQPAHASWVGKSIAGRPLADLTTADRDRTARGLDGATRLWRSAAVTVGPVAFHVLVGLSPAPTFAEADRLFWWSLAVTLLVLAAAVAVGMIGAEAMVLRPVRALQRRIEYLQGGKIGPEPRVPPGIREIAALAASFEATFASLSVRQAELKQLSSELEAKVLERTRERDRIWEVSEDLLGVGTFDGYFISFNPAWTRLLGWSEAEIRRLHVNELRHPDDLAVGEDARRRLAEGVPTVRAETRFRCKDGSYRRIDWTVTAEKDLIYMIGRDVTAERDAADALRRAEEQVREAQSRLQTVLDELPVGVFVAEAPPARVIYSNREAARLLGRAPAPSRLEDYARHGLIHADGRPFAPGEYPLVRAVTRGEVIDKQRYRYRRPDGTIVHLAISAAPIFDRQGNARFGVVSFEDVSRELAAEERLLRAQRLEAVGQLTGGVAHDFNNLLTAIMGNLELLGRQIRDHPAHRLLDNAARAAARGAQLTNQLLAFARRQRLEARPIDVNGLIGGMVGMLQSTLGGLVRVDTRLDPGVWPALADQTQIEMVILNLVINARDAMPLGGPIVIETGNAEIRMAESPEGPPPGDYVAVAVSDTGAGMPPDVLARVFEPFFTTKEPGKGSGLGLPQALGVAKQLGGGITVRSRPGAGTTVTIYLPRAAEQPRASAPAPAVGQAALRVRRVLVIDDDADVRQVTAAMLQSLGCAVVDFADAAAALDWLAAGGDAEAALLDFAMPEMNGAELAARIHALRPSMAVAIITGYADTGRLPDIGWLAGVLKKPFGTEELAEVLGRENRTAPGVVELERRG